MTAVINWYDEVVSPGLIEVLSVAPQFDRVNADGDNAALIDYFPTAPGDEILCSVVYDTRTQEQSGQLMIITYRVLVRVWIQWADPKGAAKTERSLVDLVPYLINSNPSLNGRIPGLNWHGAPATNPAWQLLGGNGARALGDAATSGFAELSGTLKRILDIPTSVQIKAPTSAIRSIA